MSPEETRGEVALIAWNDNRSLFFAKFRRGAARRGRALLMSLLFPPLAPPSPRKARNARCLGAARCRPRKNWFSLGEGG